MRKGAKKKLIILLGNYQDELMGYEDTMTEILTIRDLINKIRGGMRKAEGK